MPLKKILYSEGPFTLVQATEFDEDVLHLFNTTVWGSEGAKYAHKHSEAHLKRLGRPILVELRMNDKLVGSCVFIERTFNLNGQSLTSNMVRYLIIHPDHRGEGLMKKFAALTMQLVRESAIVPTVFIGVVEKANKRSYHIVRGVDYDPISTIKTMTFSRFFPKLDARMQTIQDGDKWSLNEKLEQFYSEHILWHTENLKFEHTYFVIWENNEIVAGLQAHKAHWVVDRLPGISGKLLRHILPNLPIINRIFNPRDFHFLAFDYIYYKPEHVSDLIKLFASVLKVYKLNAALFWCDERSRIFQDLSKVKGLGLLQNFAKGNDSHFMIGFEQMNNDQKQTFIQKPAFISGGDFI